MDIEAYRTTGRLRAAERQLRNQLPKPGKGELYIRGPIPMRWLGKAAELPGKSLHVAIVAWFKCGMEGNDGSPLSHKALRRLGVGHRAARQALARLHDAGLLRVDGHHGHRLSLRFG